MTLTRTARISRACQAVALAAGIVWTTAAGRAATAGPVVNQTRSTLTILGDGFGDSIAIIGAEDEPGTVGVYVNDVPWVYEGVQHIVIDLMDGENFVGLDRVEIPGNLVISCGDGDDAVHIGGYGYGPNRIHGNLLVSTGEGADQVRYEQGSVDGLFSIDTAGGHDEVLFGHHLIDGLMAYAGTLTGALSITTGAGNDAVAFLGSELGTTEINTGNGDDIVGLGMGHASWTIRGNELTGLSLETGAGEDLVALLDNESYADLYINLGNNADYLLLGGFGAPNTFEAPVEARGGKGNDELWNDPLNAYDVPPEFLNFETVGP
jgi:hypothetical protein